MSWEALLATGLIFGIGYGFLLQKGDFCFLSAFANLFSFGDTRVLRGIITAVVTAMIGWAVLLQFGLAPMTRLWLPAAGWTSLVGGLIFGIGMYVAGSCASGTLYRVGMGYGHFWIVLAAMGGGYLVFARLFDPFLFPALERMAFIPPTTLYDYSPLPILPTALAIVGAAALWGIRRHGWGWLRSQIQETLGFLSKTPKALLTARSWDARSVGLLLGILIVLQFALWTTLGLTGPETRIAATVAAAFSGEASVLANSYLGPMFVEYGGVGLGPAEMLIFGVIGGSALSGMLSRTWRLRKPLLHRVPAAVTGGLLMGFASRVAPGCNIANILSGIPALSVHSFLAAGGIIGGIVLAQTYTQWRMDRAIIRAQARAALA